MKIKKITGNFFGKRSSDVMRALPIDPPAQKLVEYIPDAELEHVNGGFSVNNALIGMGGGLMCGALIGEIYGAMMCLYHFYRDIRTSSKNNKDSKVKTWDITKSALSDIAINVCEDAAGLAALLGVCFGYFVSEDALREYFKDGLGTSAEIFQNEY